MDTTVPTAYEDTNNINSVWNSMEQSKGDLIERSKDYARLTVPSICPFDSAGTTEQEKANVMIGPRVVNFLAHKLIGTMFPHDRPFFKVKLSPQVEFDMSKEVPQKQIDQAKTGIEERGMQVTNVAMSKLDMIQYRPMAVDAAKHLIITGNAVVRRLKDNKRVVYGVKDFGCFRSLNGEVYDLIVRDTCRFDSLDRDVQDYVRNYMPGVRDNTTVNLFCRWRKKGEKWEFTQAVDQTNLSTFSMLAQKDMPCICLTWTLARGEHYGRGLVEDNIATFNGIDVSTTALLELFGIAADIKFLVNPGSVIDIIELIESKRGSFHYGIEGDITSPNAAHSKMADMQALTMAILDWERQLSAAFLMSSGSVRDAERVTAEEIRFYAKEIESAFGGLYSFLSMVWQYQEANWAMAQVQKSLPSVLQVTITTGLDALSQETALDNLRLSLNDLGLLNAIPEEMRAEISFERIARFIFMNRNLPLDQFTLTDQEKQAKQQQAVQQQQQLMQQQTDQNVQQAVAQGVAKK